ncbi:MAG: hypothetical protein E7621_07335, partial [Ruminococcaceae bacterium]|nr:hypothetical protein [Oscillospiraceae bacterium]
MKFKSLQKGFALVLAILTITVGIPFSAFAQSEGSIVVTFAPGTDDTVGETVTNSYDAETVITLPECTFTREGFEFAGWFDGTDIYEAGAEYTAAGDITFTPVWNNILATRVYYSADGKVDTNGDGVIDVVNATVADNTLVGSYAQTGITGVMNLYSGTFSDITCIASGGSASAACDSVYNIYGGDITG